jgi:energy-coupling factor transporter ATP-binding protein EcfA2
MREACAIEVHNLTTTYGGAPVLWDIDFELPAGHIIGIIGPNGSGKTTLLKTIMGLLPASSGYVKIFDKDLEQIRHKIAYVPQRESVDWDFPASVFDIVMMGRYRKNNLFKRTNKTDLEIVLQKTIGGVGQDYGSRIHELANGNIVVAANSDSPQNPFKTEANIGLMDVWMYSVDANFNFIADQTLGTTLDDNVVDLIMDPNTTNNSILANSSGSAQNDKTCLGNGGYDIWGLTLNSTLEVKENQTSPSIKLYPNPTSNFITIENNNSEQFLSIDLLDYSGKHIKSFDPNNTSINLSNLNPGIYLLQISTPQGNYCEKIRLE